MYYLREEMVKQGHHVDLIFAEDVPDPLVWCGLRNLTFPLLMLWTMRRFAKANGPYDIINIHTLGGAVYVFLRKVFRWLPQCVIVSHGADELRWELEKEEERLGFRPLGWKAKLLYYNLVIRLARYATRHADHVITMATSEKEFYLRRYGIHPEKISVIPNGVAKEFFQFRSYGRPPTRLLYLGGWEWRKGTRYLVEAFTQVAQACQDATLSLVGVGQGGAEGVQAFPQHLRNRLRVIPHVAADEVPQVYATHDIFVLPTLFESIPLVLPEAMASGLPIVTTRACGMQDIVEDGLTGLLVPPRDADTLAKQIMRLLSDPALCEKLGRAAQEKAREITWDKIAVQTLQVYERLLDKTGHTT
jgi:glycosyltransferase involved in cell wall biosynthesis